MGGARHGGGEAQFLKSQDENQASPSADCNTKNQGQSDEPRAGDY